MASTPKGTVEGIFGVLWVLFCSNEKIQIKVVRNESLETDDVEMVVYSRFT